MPLSSLQGGIYGVPRKAAPAAALPRLIEKLPKLDLARHHALTCPSSVQTTRATGLWGLHRQIVFARGSEALRSGSSKSMTWRPLFNTSGMPSIHRNTALRKGYSLWTTTVCIAFQPVSVGQAECHALTSIAAKPAHFRTALSRRRVERLCP